MQIYKTSLNNTITTLGELEIKNNLECHEVSIASNEKTVDPLEYTGITTDNDCVREILPI